MVAWISLVVRPGVLRRCSASDWWKSRYTDRAPSVTIDWQVEVERGEGGTQAGQQLPAGADE